MASAVVRQGCPSTGRHLAPGPAVSRDCTCPGSSQPVGDHSWATRHLTEELHAFTLSVGGQPLPIWPQGPVRLGDRGGIDTFFLDDTRAFEHSNPVPSYPAYMPLF